MGSKYEKEGMVKAGSQFINAVSNRFLKGKGEEGEQKFYFFLTLFPF